jgi:protein-tyrosine phosphatase
MTLRLCLAGLAGFLVLGNVAIAGASAWARTTTLVPPGPAVTGIGNLRVVDRHLWRGAAPSARGYESLAAAGVRTVIALRAEEDLNVDEAHLHGLGLQRVAIPLRDGQTPTPAEVDRFLAAVNAGPGPAFVHCGAGVGRTGTMVGAYLMATGQADQWTALRRNLAVGPPSLEQLAFVAGLDGGDRPGPVLVAASRVLDAPRRLWSRLRA